MIYCPGVKFNMFLGKKPFAVFECGNTDCSLDLPQADLMIFRVEKLSKQNELLYFLNKSWWCQVDKKDQVCLNLELIVGREISHDEGLHIFCNKPELEHVSYM